MLALAFALPLVLAACGDPPPAPAAEEAPPRLDFGAKRPIPVQLDLRATADGGRVTPIAGAWRGEFDFDGGTSTRCAIDSGRVPLEPGSSHRVHLVCAGAVRLADGGGRGVRLVEDGREVASGVVLP